MEILLATHNSHKANEVKNMITNKANVLNLNDVGITDAIPETGKTFAENALIKAKTVFDLTQIPTFSDDSGLCIKALGNRPGVYSARYAGTDSTEDNIRKVLSEMKGNPHREAFFICVICYYDGKEEPQFFEGKVNGTIIDEIMGNQGFGYDPIFIPEGYHETFASLPEVMKNKISHRALAMEQLNSYLLTL